MTTFNEMFNTLVDKKVIDVPIAGTDASTLRTSLVRRWSQYKRELGRYGFLPEDLEPLSVCASKYEIADGITGTRYELKRKSRSRDYTILTDDEHEHVEVTGNKEDHGHPRD